MDEAQHLEDESEQRAGCASSAWRRRVTCGAGGATAVAAVAALAPASSTSDAHWRPDALPRLPPHARSLGGDSPLARADYTSRLLTMRDGTRVAVDVALPCGAPVGAPFDVVFVQSRYGRAWRLRWPYNRLWGGRPVDLVYGISKARAACTRAAAHPRCGV
jgi:predicted acyl esterase